MTGRELIEKIQKEGLEDHTFEFEFVTGFGWFPASNVYTYVDSDGNSYARLM